MFGKLFSKIDAKIDSFFSILLKVPNKMMFSMVIVWKMTYLKIFENDENSKWVNKKNRVFAASRKLCFGHTK